MMNARSKINALATAVIAAAALALASPGLIAEEAQSDYDAVDHFECTGDWPDVECRVTGVDCLPTCYTGFCCNLPD